MGLSIFVGLLAREIERDPLDAEPLKEAFAALNAVLQDAGKPSHNEPLKLAEGQYFDAEMIGYTGLHDVRRLAIYRFSGLPLPPPAGQNDVGQDPFVKKVSAQLDALIVAPPRKGGLLSLFRKEPPPAKKEMPRFQHLLLHSDAEGFYLPRDFEDVVFDLATPQREGVGGIVGSAPRLLAECLELAELIGLPPETDPESDVVWDASDGLFPDATDWRRYGRESYGLVRLIHGCQASIRSGSALTLG